MSFTARIEGAHSDRAASASKKDGLAAPLRPFYDREAQTLANLTGWNIGKIRKTMHIETTSAPLDKKWYQRLWVN